MTKILIVEDDANTRNGLRELLREEGFVVDVAKDGLDALDKIDDTYDILLSDLKLPGIPGTDLAEKIIRQYHKIVVIIMTAYFMPELKMAAREAGVHAWLTKPLNIDNLIKLLKQAPNSSKVRRKKKTLTKSVRARS